MFWGIISKDFAGAFYVFEKESEEEKRSTIEYLKEKIQPELDARMKKYEEQLVAYEHLKALKDSNVPSYSKIRTGRKPRIPQVHDFAAMRRDNVKGIDWVEIWRGSCQASTID